MLIGLLIGLVVSDVIDSCQVVVAGGSLSGLLAALTAARQGLKTCLLEPFDEAGGQMITTPAIDFAWHKLGELNVGQISKMPQNLPKELFEWTKALKNPGKCWVSVSCFEPKSILQIINETIAKEPNLTLFYNTVVKRIETVQEGSIQAISISSVIGIQRSSSKFDKPLSEDMLDWYSPLDSVRYQKKMLKFTGGPIVIDGTEFGDLLPLSRAAYLQGYDSTDGGVETLDDQCGQAFTFPFIEEASDLDENYKTLSAPPYPEFYKFGVRGDGRPFTFDDIWSYRRLHASTEVNITKPFQQGDISLANWNPGNDYPFRYIFKTKAQTTEEISDWKGGLSYTAISEAERHAIGFHEFFKSKALTEGKRIRMKTEGFQTATGLAKFPYIRDSRRSIGVDNFILSAANIRPETPQSLTGTQFKDRLALGAYVMDFHPGICSTVAPDYVKHTDDTLPYFIPLRAFTNRDVSNLILSGKNLAVSYAASSATRLHVPEFTSGIAAGSIASFMIKQNIKKTVDVIPFAKEIRGYINAQNSPTEWTIDDKKYPSNEEMLLPVPNGIFCPEGSDYDSLLRFCATKAHVYGPFPTEMTSACTLKLGIVGCIDVKPVVINGMRSKGLIRWKRDVFMKLRGRQHCPFGSSRSKRHENYCVEQSKRNPLIFGPFSSDVVQNCIRLGHGVQCYYTAMKESIFFKSIR